MTEMEKATWALVIVTGLLALFTFCAVLVALFWEDVKRRWRRPRLEVKVQMENPHCIKIPMTVTISENNVGYQFTVDCYYLRIWILNKGKEKAEQVQVFAETLFCRDATDTFREESHFLPMNLLWSDYPVNNPKIYADRISPAMGKHCDLGHIVLPLNQIDPKLRPFQVGQHKPGVPEDKTTLALDLEVTPNTGSHLLSPGVYRLRLKIAATNCEPVTRTIEINLTGQWHDDENRMLSDGIGLKLVNS